MTWMVEGKTALVTGGNSGIGKEIAAELAERGADVVIASRNAGKGESAAAELRERTGRNGVEFMSLDLASFASVRGFAKRFLDEREALHVLVNNAGLTLSRREETEDGHEATFQINHLGPFLLTRLLLDRVVASAPARIVNVSSGAHKASRGLDFDDLDRERRRYRGMAAYNDSKLCNIYFTRELDRRIGTEGVTVNAFHPGFVRTNFSFEGDTFLLALGIRIGSLFARSPARGARTGVHLVTSPDVEGVSGAYFFNEHPAKISRIARDDEAAQRLWEVSERLTGLERGPA